MDDAAKEQPGVAAAGMKILYNMAIESGPQFGYSLVNRAALGISGILSTSEIAV